MYGIFFPLPRRADPLPVPGVHHLRAEDLPAVVALLRRGLVLRAGDGPAAGGRGEEEGRGQVQAGLPGGVPGGDGVHVQVGAS